MLPAMLKKAPTPYKTVMLGKWNQGFYTKEHVPVARGFDKFFGFYDGGESYFTHITPFAVWKTGAPYSWTPFQYATPNMSTFASLVDLQNETAQNEPPLGAAHSLNGNAVSIVRILMHTPSTVMQSQQYACPLSSTVHSKISEECVYY
jgi:arylsulfatase A-like enzyme